jgi:hypothetical protein
MRDLKLPWDEIFDSSEAPAQSNFWAPSNQVGNFVLQSMDLLKLGGCAVHTTEFKVASM